jgi:hypothetical protein
VGWKDQAFVLIMSSVLSGDKQVVRLRRRPKETSSKAKTTRVPFGNQPTKELVIPAIIDSYNYHMGAVDEFDHLIAQNARLRHVRRGGHQALEHWLLRTVLVNCYLLSHCSNVPKPREVCFRSQQDFRKQIIGGLLAKGRDGDICPKRRIAHISHEAKHTPVNSYKQVKMASKGWCVSCQGLRYRDRPRKRVALGQIVANKGRESSRHDSIYGCRQCDVHLCKQRGCFDIFHGRREN